MSIVMLVWLIIAVGLGFALVRLFARELPPGSGSDQDRRLADQAEQIEQLEAEVQRVKEQADFTEKLLTERGSASAEDAPD